MTDTIYRNESLIQMETHHIAPEKTEQLIETVRKKWALLREKGYAGDYPVEILHSDSDKTKIIEIFKWRSQQERANAESDTDLAKIAEEVLGFSSSEGEKEICSEVVRGFNQNFPETGGIELLKGVCSCLLTIDGVVKDYPMSVKNGVVLMHRSPPTDFDGDGRNEMYLKILMHGGEIVQDALGPIRVEQNFSLPNDGIVKSNSSDGNDFPGTAIWRVAWKIQTAMGPIITDPDKPLIFGPTTVSHYPPVGTQFHSSTGPVSLFLEKTGEKVGTLTPGELTAFDIVVTKDDEICADILNAAPDDIFTTLTNHTS